AGIKEWNSCLFCSPARKTSRRSRLRSGRGANPYYLFIPRASRHLISDRSWGQLDGCRLRPRIAGRLIVRISTSPRTPKSQGALVNDSLQNLAEWTSIAPLAVYTRHSFEG